MWTHVSLGPTSGRLNLQSRYLCIKLQPQHKWREKLGQ